MDPLEYKDLYKTISNTCVGYTPTVNNIDVEELTTTQTATRAAYLKAIADYFRALLAKYYDADTGELCTECISSQDFNKIVNAIQGPTGLYEYFLKDYYEAQLKLWNSLRQAGDPNKQTGVVTYNLSYSKVYPANQTQAITLTVDYTDAQTPTGALYRDFREKLGIFLQKFKAIHYLTMKMDFQKY